MDKNLNSSPKLPWWMIFIQISPLILQLVSEIINRTQPVSVLPDAIINTNSSANIPDPLDVKLE